MNNHQMNHLVDLLCTEKDVSHDIGKMLAALGLEDLTTDLSNVKDLSNSYGLTSTTIQQHHDGQSNSNIRSSNNGMSHPPTTTSLLDFLNNTQKPSASHISATHTTTSSSPPFDPFQFASMGSSLFSADSLSNLLQFDSLALSPYPDGFGLNKGNFPIMNSHSESSTSLNGFTTENPLQPQHQHHSTASGCILPPLSTFTASMDNRHSVAQDDETHNCSGGLIDHHPLISSSEFLGCRGASSEADFLMRKLGGFRNIGWTLDHRLNEDNGQKEHQALVYSLHTFDSYASGWMTDESLALKTALTKCYEAEQGDDDQNSSSQKTPGTPETRSTDAFSPPTPLTPGLSDHSLTSTSQKTSSSSPNRLEMGDNSSAPTRHASSHSDKAFNQFDDTDNNLQQREVTRVLVWCSYVPDSMSSNTVISIWKALLAPTTKLIGALRTPIPSQVLFVFDDLLSAIDFIRTAKSKQLEFFDLLVAGESSSGASSSHHDVLFHPHTGDAVGFSLVNVSPQHPTCIHTLLRLSQKDAVALGHKRTSTETLRLLLTHPEVSPVMVVPSAQPYGSFAVGRTTPLSQTPSHRRASIWCALCCTQASDIPGAWKHLSRNPHEALRDARNASLLEWVANEHPALSATLMTEKRPELSPEAIKAKSKETPKHSKASRSADRRAEASVLEQLNLLKSHKAPRSSFEQIAPPRDISWNDGNSRRKASASPPPPSLHPNASTAKGLNPEASPFIPCSPTQQEQHPRESSLSGNDPSRFSSSSFASPEDIMSLNDIETSAASVSVDEATLLREWSVRQGLSPRQHQGKQLISTPSSILQPSLRSSFNNEEESRLSSSSSPIRDRRVLPLDATLLMLEEEEAAKRLKTNYNKAPSSEVQHQVIRKRLESNTSTGSSQRLLEGWTSDGSALLLSSDYGGQEVDDLLSSTSSSRRGSVESLFNCLDQSCNNNHNISLHHHHREHTPQQQRTLTTTFDRSDTPKR